MKKKLLAGLAAGVIVAGMASNVMAIPTTLVAEGSSWSYSVLTNDLWGTNGTAWAAAGYNSADWNSLTLTGNAAFGNTANYGGTGLIPVTNWAANTDLALKQQFFIDGELNKPVTLSVASDNGFMVFINGYQVAKQNAEGFTFKWEYVLNLDTLSPFKTGSNLIQVLAEDHGGITYFDLKLTGDVTPVPEPTTTLLVGLGVVGLAGIARRKRS